MATTAQIQANRSNAQKSTGPRTAQGKAIVAQNALKHGLRTEKAVIAGEDVGEFEFYRDELLGELAPAGAVESVLAERVVSLSWRLRRAERAQNEAFDTLLARVAADPFRTNARAAEADGLQETPLGRAVIRDFANGRVLERLSMYERRIEYSLYKSMNELQKLRLTRELEDERWGRPHPANATEQVPCVGEGPLRQTNPIAGQRDAEDTTSREPGVGSAEQSQSTGADSRCEPDPERETAFEGQTAACGGPESCPAQGSRTVETGVRLARGNG
ncbi:MAG: hypothetical protein JW741_12655 [Sedimentisphaerales bacterium]|nr:hypothetical protein [Sedimentisphaerales bacterium]